MIEDFEQVAKAIGHPSRARILKLLERGEMHGSELRSVLGLAGGSLSRHLNVLRSAGLIFVKPEGRGFTCRLADHARNPLIRPALGMVRDGLSHDPRILADRRRREEIRAARAVPA